MGRYNHVIIHDGTVSMLILTEPSAIDSPMRKQSFDRMAKWFFFSLAKTRLIHEWRSVKMRHQT